MVIQQTATQKLDSLVERSQAPLFILTSVWPFDIFPNKVIIDENKVDFIYNDFFWTKHTFSVLVKNINNVQISLGPFFAAMTLEMIGYEANPDTVKFLPIKDTVRARRIIMGLAACAKEDIDLSGMAHEEVLMQVEKIGQANAIEKDTLALT